MLALRKYLALGMVIMAAWLAVANWGTSLGTAWLVALLGWLNVFFDTPKS